MDDPVLEEEFRRLKKRDLFQTYFFKVACRTFGPPKCRERLIVAPPMPKFTVPVHCASVKDLVETSGTGPSLQAQSCPGEGGSELANWIKERKRLRRELDRLGELDRWLHNKPTLTDMEYQVMDRMEATRKTQTPPQLLPEMSKVQGGMQDEEVLTSLQTVRMDNETHTYLSTLGGPTGRAVERFKRQCQEEYLDTLKQCQQHKLPISKATLQRVCLHPGDETVYKRLLLRKADSSAVLRGRVSCINPPPEGKEEEDDENGEESAPHRFHKEMSRRRPLTWRSDPNAFWPGREGHVRLYQPVMSSRPESVLFQLVKHTPAPSTGYWPINQAGYYTSGDINRQKAFIL